MTTPGQTHAVPDYVKDLQAIYGAPSDSGYGSAVFFQPQLAADELETTARSYYQYFVGRGWQAREAAWLQMWKRAYVRNSGDEHDVVAELRSITDRAARAAVAMILDSIDNAERARHALAAAMDDPTVGQLAAYNLGDGEAMSGILVAAWRANGEATFLVFLLD